MTPEQLDTARWRAGKLLPGDERQHGEWDGLTHAMNAIERSVDQKEGWAKECAAKEDYTGASRFQAGAIDLHCAVAIIRDAIAGHTHDHAGFRPDLGDTCSGCAYDVYIATKGKP